MSPERTRRRIRALRVAGWWLFAASLVAGAVLLLADPAARRLLDPDELAEWVRRRGGWAPLGYLLASVVAAVLWVPRTPVAMAAGVLFGPAWGAFWAVAGGIVGSVVNYVWARALLHRRRDAVSAIHLPKWARSLAAIARSHDFGLVALGHLSPVGDFQAINYLAGAAAMPFPRFMGACLVGIGPGSAVYAVLASAAVTGKVLHAAVSALFITFLMGMTVVVLRRWHRQEQAQSAGGEDSDPRPV